MNCYIDLLFNLLICIHEATVEQDDDKRDQESLQQTFLSGRFDLESFPNDKNDERTMIAGM